MAWLFKKPGKRYIIFYDPHSFVEGDMEKLTLMIGVHVKLVRSRPMDPPYYRIEELEEG